MGRKSWCGRGETQADSSKDGSRPSDFSGTNDYTNKNDPTTAKDDELFFLIFVETSTHFILRRFWLLPAEESRRTAVDVRGQQGGRPRVAKTCRLQFLETRTRLRGNWKSGRRGLTDPTLLKGWDVPLVSVCVLPDWGLSALCRNTLQSRVSRRGTCVRGSL